MTINRVSTAGDGEELLKPSELSRVFVDTNLEDLGPGTEIVPDVLEKITRLSHAQPPVDAKIAASPGRKPRQI